MAYRDGDCVRESCDPNCLAAVLDVSRNLPSGRLRSSAMDYLASLKKYRSICARQDGFVGLGHRLHEIRSVGLSTHHDVELSAISAEEDQRCAQMDGGRGVCGVGNRRCFTLVDSSAIAKLESVSGEQAFLIILLIPNA